MGDTLASIDSWYGSCRVVDCGIDWFTTTATDRKTALLLLIKAERIMSQEHRAGHFIKPWRMAGYSGWRCGRIEYGPRDDGAIVRLSSSLADLEWWNLFQVTGRCSRIDLQATLRHDDGPIRPILKVERSFRKFYKGRTDGPTITVWRDNKQGHTLYLGKRQSDLYLRCYNKEAQSQDDFFQGCVRIELEVKNRLVQSVIDSMLSYDTVALGVCGVLSSFLKKRGGAPLIIDDCREWLGPSQPAKDVLRTLAWLREQVKPSVIELTRMGHLEQLLEHLGLTNFVRPL